MLICIVLIVLLELRVTEDTSASHEALFSHYVNQRVQFVVSAFDMPEQMQRVVL